MSKRRVRIMDIAEELGLSTATVSNVIHGKTKKISDETVKRVQELLEKKQYIPSMAGILLAQNELVREIEASGYFMMIKVTKAWDEIAKFASMWNLEGMIVLGFCEQDYKKLKEFTHVPFVVYDGFFPELARMCNITIDNYDGGRQVGEYFRSLGHVRTLCIADNHVCMDQERFLGFREGVGAESWCRRISDDHASGSVGKTSEYCETVSGKRVVREKFLDLFVKSIQIQDSFFGMGYAFNLL